ncbi:hypothetical protein VMCG_03265 [Cytospora schulzeri]|uniref:Uncharacterized protein n=1 Tax=Cytospora schulzeri TaxID=448051 RepID=A0A423WY33_9PEZI|nr:hypothetical protein VMCG_03265 [Valsa malicola]
MSPHDSDEKTLNLNGLWALIYLPPPAANDGNGLVPAPLVDDVHDGPPVLVLLLQVHAVALLDQDLEHVCVAVLHGLQHGVPAPVHEVDVGAPGQQQLQDLGVVVAHAADGLDDGEVLAGGVDVGARLVDEVPHDVLVALADGRGQRGEDAAVLVLDRETRAQQETDALGLVGAHGHLHHALEGLGVGHGREELLEDRGPLHRHAEGPVLATDGGLGATAQEEVDHVGAVLADRRRQGRVALGRLGVGVDAVVEEVDEGVHVVVRDGLLDDAPGLGGVAAGLDDLREEVRVRAVGEEEGDDVGAVVADGGAQRGVDAVLLGVGVDAGLEEGPHRVDVVDARRELHDAGGHGELGAVRKEELEEGRVVAAGPERVLGAREVGVGAPVEQELGEVEALDADGLDHGARALAVLAVGVAAVVEQEVDDGLGRLAVDGPHQDRVVVGHDAVRVAAVHEEELHQVELPVEHGQRQRRVAVRARAQVRVRAVLDEHLGALEEAHLGGLEEGRAVVLVKGVGVGAEEEQEPDRLGVAVDYGLPEEVDLLEGVGRHAPVEQLLDDAVVPLLHRLRQGHLELRVVAPGVIPRRPPGHCGWVRLEAGHLLRRPLAEVQVGQQVLEQQLGLCRALSGLRILFPRLPVRVGLEALDRVISLTRLWVGPLTDRRLAVPVLAVLDGARSDRPPMSTRSSIVVAEVMRLPMKSWLCVEWRSSMARGGSAGGSSGPRSSLLAARPVVVVVVRVPGHGPLDAVHAVQGGRKPRVADADGGVDLVAADGPPEDEGGHAQGLTGLLEARPHLVHVRVGKHHLEALCDAGEAVLLVVVEEARDQLVEHDEVVVGLAEVPLHLGRHLGGEAGVGLVVVGGVAEARLDGPQDPAHLEELVGEVPEPLDVVLDGAEVLEHADGDGVAQHRGLVAELEGGFLPSGRHGCRWSVVPSVGR